jgi:hypothetical protein
LSPVQTIVKNYLFVKSSVDGFTQVPDYLLFEGQADGVGSVADNQLWQWDNI